MNNLKPCPFCGSKSTGVLETVPGYYPDIFYLAVCNSCRCRTNTFKNKDDAAEAWNRRVNDGKTD